MAKRSAASFDVNDLKCPRKTRRREPPVTYNEKQDTSSEDDALDEDNAPNENNITSSEDQEDEASNEDIPDGELEQDFDEEHSLNTSVESLNHEETITTTTTITTTATNFEIMIPTRKRRERKTKDRKIAPSYHRIIVENPEEAEKYNRTAAIRHFEMEGKKPSWKLVMTNIPTANICESLESFSFTCCNWGVAGFRASSGLGVCPKKANPYRTGKFPVPVPSDFKEKYCGTSYFKGCCSPLCDGKTPPCSANLQIKYISNGGGNGCDIFVWGAHAYGFYEYHRNLKPRRKVLEEIDSNLECNARPTPITSLLLLKATNKSSTGQVVDAKHVSVRKRNLMLKRTGKPKKSFFRALKILNTVTNKCPTFRVIQSVDGVDINDMNENKFCFILYNERIIECSKDIILHKVNMDACFKFFDDHPKYKRIPITAITFLDENKTSQVAFLVVATQQTAEIIKSTIQAIEEDLKKLFNIQEWRPTFMVDDGKAETSALIHLDIPFIICKFHLVKAWSKYIKKLMLKDKELKKRLRKQLYLLYESQTVSIYTQRYNELLTFAPQQFKLYYYNTWHKEGFFRHWTCINRASCYADWATNNITESTFRRMQQTIGVNYKRLDVLLEKLLDILLLQEFTPKFNRYSTKTEIEAKQRFSESEKLTVEKGENTNHQFRVKSSGETTWYNTNTLTMTCDCEDYYKNCRPCKHLFASVREFVKIENITIPKEKWKLYLNAVFLYCHDPSLFKKWNIQVKEKYFIYPTTNATGRPVLNKNKEYVIKSVEGARIKNRKLEILVVWEGETTNEEEEEELESWGEYDKDLNGDITKKFFNEVLRYAKSKKGKGREKLVEVNRSEKDYYFFTERRRKLKEVPSPSTIQKFVDIFKL